MDPPAFDGNAVRMCAGLLPQARDEERDRPGNLSTETSAAFCLPKRLTPGRSWILGISFRSIVSPFRGLSRCDFPARCNRSVGVVTWRAPVPLANIPQASEMDRSTCIREAASDRTIIIHQRELQQKSSEQQVAIDVTRNTCKYPVLGRPRHRGERGMLRVIEQGAIDEKLYQYSQPESGVSVKEGEIP